MNAVFHRKRTDLTGILLLMTVFLLLVLCGCEANASPDTETAAAVPVFPALGKKDGLRIAVASDLHFNPDDRPNPDNPQETQYSSELADALLWDVQKQDADMLLLTGDLCNGGKIFRHEALTEKLRRLQETGTEVYVLPGNHDLAPVTQTEFRALYGAFGYDDAFSRDAASLSYCVVRDGLMLMMLDTAGYSVSAADLPGQTLPDSSEPYVSQQTLAWVKAMLKTAVEQNLLVLPAGHYNLLSPYSSDDSNKGYYVENGGLLTALLADAGVPLYLSGHTHQRAVYQKYGLTELVTEFLLGYPTAYSVLDVGNSTIRYTPRRIDVDAWAEETAQSDPVLLGFSQWQQDELRRYSLDNITYMSQRNPLLPEEKTKAAEFFYRVMDSYWSGNLSEDRTAIEAMPGFGPFFRCSEGYAYGWWLRDLMNTASPMLKGFLLEY